MFLFGHLSAPLLSIIDQFSERGERAADMHLDAELRQQPLLAPLKRGNTTAFRTLEFDKKKPGTRQDEEPVGAATAAGADKLKGKTAQVLNVDTAEILDCLFKRHDYTTKGFAMQPKFGYVRGYPFCL